MPFLTITPPYTGTPTDPADTEAAHKPYSYPLIMPGYAFEYGLSVSIIGTNNVASVIHQETKYPLFLRFNKPVYPSIPSINYYPESESAYKYPLAVGVEGTPGYVVYCMYASGETYTDFSNHPGVVVMNAPTSEGYIFKFNIASSHADGYGIIYDTQKDIVLIPFLSFEHLNARYTYSDAAILSYDKFFGASNFGLTLHYEIHIAEDSDYSPAFPSIPGWDIDPRESFLFTSFTSNNGSASLTANGCNITPDEWENSIVNICAGMYWYEI